MPFFYNNKNKSFKKDKCIVLLIESFVDLFLSHIPHFFVLLIICVFSVDRNVCVSHAKHTVLGKSE